MKAAGSDICVVGVHATRQARVLEGETAESITRSAISGVLADAGLDASDIDGLNVSFDLDLQDEFRLDATIEPRWYGERILGALPEAANAIANGECHTALVAIGAAGSFVNRTAVAPWTRPQHEFYECWGMFTAAFWALGARRHMHLYGTTPEQLAYVAATIRNNGHRNPEAIYFGRGPYSIEDVLASRMIADPYHLLDCASTTEGAAAIIVSTRERARDMDVTPVTYLGHGWDGEYSDGAYYSEPPLLEHRASGRQDAAEAFAAAGVTPQDIDVCEIYDNFSFEVIRHFEAMGFCEEGEGGDYVTSGVIDPGGRHPLTTDGGLMSFSHPGSVGMLLHIVQACRQLRGDSAANQVENARLAVAGGPKSFELLARS